MNEAGFWANVEKTDGCWLWTAGLAQGYGHLGWNGRTDYAHRVAYELLVGPVPEGLTIDHLCRERRCVNPTHMEAVTRWENVRRSPTNLFALRAKASRCHRGHEFTTENTMTDSGRRKCRRCHNERQRRYREAQRGDRS
jgi:HNH endonuclease